MTARNLILLRRVDSTQRLSRRVVKEYLAEEEAVPAATLVAYEQTAGQGRQGRAWKSPPGGGTYATLIRRLSEQEKLPRLPLLLGVVLAEALHPWLGDECRLKWPNDLLVQGRKLGGILIDVIGQPGEDSVVLAGFGINRGRRGKAPEVPEATSLAREMESPPSTAELTARLISSLEDAWGRLEDPAWLLERYRRISAHRPGEEMSFRVGKNRERGVFQGFDSHGRLVIETAAGTKIISSGEVFFGS